MSRRSLSVFAGVTGLTLAMLVTTTFTGPMAVADPLVADLRADTNRDGRISFADDAAEDVWRRSRGAIMLPNLDDDARRCPGRAPDGSPIPDVKLPACSDATDTIVNNTADASDLARLHVEGNANAAVSSYGKITVNDSSRSRVHVFVKRGDKWVLLPNGGKLSAAEIRVGAELGIEARDIVRDKAVWDGLVTVTLGVYDGSAVSSDRVVMRVAPLLFQNDLLPVQRLMVSNNAVSPAIAGDVPGDVRGIRKSPTDMRGRALSPRERAARENGEQAYRRELRAGLDKAGLTRPFIEYPTGGDIWVQDVFEPGYASMPSASGEQRIRIYVRSANASRSGGQGGRPLREAGRPIFTSLRGPSVGAVQQWDAKRLQDPDMWESDTFSSTGNFGAIPPYTSGSKKYPAGRMLYGASGVNSPDKAFTKMLQAQGYQSPVVIDTSWLLVGHIDEFLTFLPAKNERGWVVGLGDARLGRKLLQDLVAAGKGNQQLVQGVPADLTPYPNLTVRQALSKPELTKAYETAVAGTDKALAQLKAATGLTEAEIVRLPVLWDGWDTASSRSLLAYLPGVANGIATGTSTYLAPRQHGPKDGAADVFQRETVKRLRTIGMSVAWVENWEYAHLGAGEIHCVTNAQRDLAATKPWWGEASG